MKKLLLFVFFPTIFFTQIPSGYYDSASGLSGYQLKSALHNIISSKIISYNYGDVGTFYSQTDADKYYENDNTVLDLYSENPTGPDAYEYNFTQNIGSANAEGLGWNKEHMMPQSTFYSNYPMDSDLNFIIPADARINQLRSNYPYGVGGTTVYHAFTNGSKICNNATPNAIYKGRVYEPIDEFKGDVARSILYFAVRYEGKLGTFKIITNTDPAKDQSPLDGTEEQAYDQSFIALMQAWSAKDPVSQREIDRNNVIYGIQKNRNPFIDHAEWVNLIWSKNLSATAPQSPTVLTASKVSAYFVHLNWIAPSDPSIIGFKIFQDGVEVGSSKNNSFIVDHLNPATNYNFTVKSYNNKYLKSAETNILPVLTFTTDIYAKDLIFTKYLKGTGDNKALEITNKTGHSVNLDSYSISIQFKGTAYYFADPLQLEGKVADNETFVMMNVKSAFSCYKPSQAKFVSGAPSLTFNGSNFLSLRYKSTTVDALGALDTDNFNDLGNVSLYRLNNVKQPTTTFNIAEWQKNPSDYCENLGTLSTSESSENTNNKIVIYPNPIAESQIFVQGLEIKNFNLAQVYDLSGKLIISEKQPFRNKNFINVDRLKKGIYTLKIDTQSFKIIKK
ncbi:MAG: endonuclease [Chryseobacterium sp.]|nr:endonuclease [Chryseobacterium sp.]